MILRLFFAILIPPCYLSIRVLCKKNLSLWLRITIVFLLFLISQMFTINRFFFKSLSGPDMPSWLLLTQAFLFTAEILFFFFLFVTDCWTLLCSLWKTYCSRPKAMILGMRDKGIDRRNFLRTGSFALISTALAGEGVRSGHRLPEVHRMELLLPQIPDALNRFRIVQISDIHIGTLTSPEWAEELTRLALAEHPDLICLCGDLSDGLESYQCTGGGPRLEAFKKLSLLRAPLGVFSCLGNHEYYSNKDAWLARYQKCGIQVLQNEAVLLKHNNAKIALIGRNDPVAVQRFGEPFIPARNILETVQDADFHIMLDHRPTRADENALAGVDLQLSGHTHGGQCLGMDRFVARQNEDRIRGWYTIQNTMPLYVSTGAGLWSGFPIRLGIPAEIASITFRKNKKISQSFIAREAKR